MEERIFALAEYIIEHQATVRGAAHAFGISKSTVHKDVTERLRIREPALAAEVKKVLDQNKAQRHLRGGEATREKYLLKKRGAVPNTERSTPKSTT